LQIKIEEGKANDEESANSDTDDINQGADISREKKEHVVVVLDVLVPGPVLVFLLIEKLS